MEEVKEKYFGILGQNYQLKLISELITPNNYVPETNRLFFDEVIDNLHSHYFDTLDMRRIMVLIKDYYDRYSIPPNIDNLYALIQSEIQNEVERRELVARLELIKKLWKDYKSSAIHNDRDFTKNKCLTFIKQQELLQLNNVVQQKLTAGVVDENYILSLSDKYKKVLDIGSPINYLNDIFDSVDDVLAEDYRIPIGTGVKEIDVKIDGGITKGEMCFVLAGQGVGKTSFLTLIGNNAYLAGYNVLHIILEGNKNDIRRTHYSKIFKIPPKELHTRKDYILNRIKTLKTDLNVGNLKVERLKGDVTPSKFRKFVHKQEEKLGYKFDAILLDYIDCMSPDEKTANKYENQEDVVKKIESICEEEQWRMFIGIQAKKESTDKRILSNDDVGGSVERSKKAHLLIGLGADKDQKTKNEINVAIIKCRFARGGWTWENCKFNDVFDFEINNDPGNFKVIEGLSEYQPVIEKDETPSVITNVSDDDRELVDILKTIKI